ncbi:MAG TPA: hypothetical protein VMR41_05775 [Patescibacteria group bacterium]|nr:hypothetical protein [Patescibacteria group bacterium]
MDDQNKVVEPVEEAEIVEEKENTSVASTDDQSTVLLSLEEMIKSHLSSLEKIRLELRQTKEQFDDSFANNPTYRENAEKAKAAAKDKGTTRQNIMKQPAVAQLSDKMKSLRLDVKEKAAALSDYLLEYQRLTQAATFENDGEVLEIVNSAKLVKRS